MKKNSRKKDLFVKIFQSYMLKLLMSLITFKFEKDLTWTEFKLWKK